MFERALKVLTTCQQGPPAAAFAAFFAERCLLLPSLTLTQERDQGGPPPPNEVTFQDSRTLEIGGERIELAWHGANHTPDNMIIHLPDHDTLTLIDIVNPGWAPVYLSNLTEDTPGYVEAPANALAYSWKHFIGGHLGRLRYSRGRRLAPAVHGGHRRELQEVDRRRRPDALLRQVRRERLGGVPRQPGRHRRYRGRARDREVHRRARSSRRIHREHEVPGDAVDPARVRPITAEERSTLAQFLQLPRGIPASITHLARTLVPASADEYQKHWRYRTSSAVRLSCTR